MSDVQTQLGQGYMNEVQLGLGLGLGSGLGQGYHE